MLSDLDETIRQLLINEGEFVPAEVDISFDIPTRDWSAGISKPTLNCYLFDIHERRALREEGWRLEGRGSREAARRQPPLFFELTYLITAWTTAVEDEHRLLWHVLETLMDHPTLPVERLQGSLRDYEWPIHTNVAQLEGVLKSPGEFWTALENQLKPSISFVVTLARERRAERAGPPVLSTGIRLQLPEASPNTGFRVNQIFRLPAATPLGGLTIAVEGHPDRAVTDDAGVFRFDGLAPGRYLLTLTINGQVLQRMVRISGEQAAEQPRYSDIIRDQAGTPLAGVTVEVEHHNRQAVTGDDGRFTLDLAPGRYTLVIRHDGWSQRRPVLIRDHSYRITMQMGGAVADT
ncbi:MAG TPA: Pvc16 family protein [Roseiflexaceae bacterium]|nr:Pvc16 family protein [Roseiflexaceae bacterium]